MNKLSSIYLRISIIAVFVSINLYVWVYISNHYKKIIQSVQKNNPGYVIDISDEHNISYFMNNYRLNYDYSVRKINNPNTFLGNDSLNLQKLLSRINKETLIYRFSGLYCDACNTFGMKKIKQHFTDFATSDRIIFIGSEIDPRLKVDFYGKNILGIKKGFLGLPLEEVKTPFYFLLDKNGRIKMTFIPDKSMPEYTDSYLEFVKKNYFSGLH